MYNSKWMKYSVMSEMACFVITFVLLFFAFKLSLVFSFAGALILSIVSGIGTYMYLSGAFHPKNH